MNNEIKEIQRQRGNIYGDYDSHAKAVEDIVFILERINYEKNSGFEYPKGFRTTLFYLTSKLVRLAATPTHKDSVLDLSSYADLWLKVIEDETNNKEA